MTAKRSKHHRYFLVGFKDGTLRSVIPKENDPLEFEQQVVASEALGILLMTPGRKSEAADAAGSRRVSLYTTSSIIVKRRKLIGFRR